jgi:DUF971 family protein
MTDTPEAGPSTTPTNIHADRPNQALIIEWGDGHQTTYDFTALRWLCPCAFCRGEAGQPGWLDSNPTLSDDQVTLTDMALVGHYAVQPFWADGHSTGFYPFQRLREECPCPDHQARRAARPSPQAGSQPHQHE